MGGGTATLRALIREYLFISLFRACAESLASENASRLAAMQRADKNIDELLEHLNGTFHRLRQSGIDEELFDVISGFEALSKRKHIGARGEGPCEYATASAWRIRRRDGGHRMSRPRMVFLFDVDNTLIDNDRVIVDLEAYLIHEVGPSSPKRYFDIFEQLRTELGYSDYLGPSSATGSVPARPALPGGVVFLVNYPFANRLYPGSLDAVEHVARSVRR